jgi:hypothetical protein
MPTFRKSLFWSVTAGLTPTMFVSFPGQGRRKDGNADGGDSCVSDK